MSNKIKLQELQRMVGIKDTNFFEAYKKLVNADCKSLTENEKYLLLRIAVVFLNEGEQELEKFGYRLILGYSNCFQDYQPLYDIALEKDYIPVVKFIEEKYLNLGADPNLHRLLRSSYNENFMQLRNNEEIYFSLGQKRIYNFSMNEEDYIIVAPTSYGKSELIIHKVENNLDKNICIIVPTKSLLAQTRKNLIKNSKIRESHNKIITHPDMLNGISTNFIAVLTQERLLRLLQKHTDLSFDIVLIDEAHNLIENDSREILTIQDLKILKKRNPNIKYYYFTPFLVEPQKLTIFPNRNLLVDKIHEFIKIEKYFYCDLLDSKKELHVYDQFLNQSFSVEENSNIDDEFEFINKYAANKNIIYLNRPKHVEDFTNSIRNTIDISEKILKVQKALKDFLHKDYNLIKSIENGVVYHHGGMPENVRLYVENAFSEITEIKYIITTSTLLQGVNIPAEKIFLLTTIIGKNSNLNASQFKNLVGRVCRFSEVFNKKTGNLKLLEPEIFIIKSKYHRKAGSRKEFLEKRVKDNIIISDEINNPLIKQNLVKLDDYERDAVIEAEEYQENIEVGSSNLTDLRVVKSKIAKACFKNNVHDFDIFENEKILDKNLDENLMTDIKTPRELLSSISSIFIKNIKFKYDECSKFKKKNGKPYKENGKFVEKLKGTYCERSEGLYVDKNCDYCRTDKSEFIRLREEKAQNFYEMFLTWRSKSTSYSEMIFVFKKYWDNLLPEDKQFIYVGGKWGEIEKKWEGGEGGWKKLYVDLTKKNESEITNLAIVKIQEERDFLDFTIMPYVEILNDLKLINENFYDKIKYGTDDEEMIKMLKEGFSIELAKIIKNGKYSEYIDMTDTLRISNEIIKKMKENNENEILIFEIQYYI